MKYQNFRIRHTRDQSFTAIHYLEHQMALSAGSDLDCGHCTFDLTIEPSLQVTGYDTYWNGLGMLKFLPKESNITHGVRCRLRRQSETPGALDACSVVVVYPYDTHIVLNSNRVLPGTINDCGQKFAGIAKRMLDIVTCIDITDTPPSKRPANLSQHIETHPNLENCVIDLSG